MTGQSLDDQFTNLLTAHQGQVFGYIFAAVRNLDDAEELYQQTSLVLWRKFSSYRPDSDFARWACKAAKFEILHFQRHKRRTAIRFSDQALSNLAEVQASPGEDAGRFQQETLGECVDQLSQDDQQLVRLCYGRQYSVKQAAEELQRSVQTLYNSLSRIRHSLFECIQLRLGREQKP
jgi:RNA polymerase sigma-70 factor, ECF subfamily